MCAKHDRGLQIICANDYTGVQTDKRVGGSTKRQEKKLKHSGDDLDHKDDHYFQHKS